MKTLGVGIFGIGWVAGDVTHHPFHGMIDDLATALLEKREASANIHEAYKSHKFSWRLIARLRQVRL